MVREQLGIRRKSAPIADRVVPALLFFGIIIADGIGFQVQPCLAESVAAVGRIISYAGSPRVAVFRNNQQMPAMLGMDLLPKDHVVLRNPSEASVTIRISGHPDCVLSSGGDAELWISGTRGPQSWTERLDAMMEFFTVVWPAPQRPEPSQSISLQFSSERIRVASLEVEAASDASYVVKSNVRDELDGDKAEETLGDVLSTIRRNQSVRSTVPDALPNPPWGPAPSDSAPVEEQVAYAYWLGACGGRQREALSRLIKLSQVNLFAEDAANALLEVKSADIANACTNAAKFTGPPPR